MKALLYSLVFPLGLALAVAAHAQAPAGAPSGSTGLCKDGSYTSADAKRGACRGHKGVKEWYGATAAPAAATRTTHLVAPPRNAASAAPSATPVPAPAPSPASMPARHTADVSHAESGLANRAAAPGGGNGRVWVNSETKVYHCSTDRYYGKTKAGEYLSEADAIAKGAHAAHGKACSQ